MATPRHFLDLDGFSAQALTALLTTAAHHKAPGRAAAPPPLAGRILALLFQAQSTRTRISFAAAIGQLGGQGILLPRSELHLDRGETLADTAAAISCYVDAVLLRSTEQNFFDQFVAESRVPVINGLTRTLASLSGLGRSSNPARNLRRQLARYSRGVARALQQYDP